MLFIIDTSPKSTRPLGPIVATNIDTTRRHDPCCLLVVTQISIQRFSSFLSSCIRLSPMSHRTRHFFRISLQRYYNQACRLASTTYQLCRCMHRPSSALPLWLCNPWITRPLASIPQRILRPPLLSLPRSLLIIAPTGCAVTRPHNSVPWSVRAETRQGMFERPGLHPFCLLSPPSGTVPAALEVDSWG